jgi:hypothetical protein
MILRTCEPISSRAKVECKLLKRVSNSSNNFRNLALGLLAAILIIGVSASGLVHYRENSNRTDEVNIADPCSASLAPGLIAHPIAVNILLPHQIRLPPNAAIYGVAISGIDMRRQSYSTIGFDHGRCSFSMGADGASIINIYHGPFQNESQVFSPGGVALTSAFACAYIPQVMSAVAAAQEGSSQDCDVSTSEDELITKIDTHVAGLYFTAVLVPPHTSDEMITPSPSPVTTYAVFAARIEEVNKQPVVSASESITCALPLNDADICSASLSYFAASFADQPPTPPQALMRILDEIHSIVTPQA